MAKRKKSDRAHEPVGQQPHAELVGTDLERSFGGVHALRGVSLTIRPGRVLAVIGPNGAGKSSLINVLTGLYKPTNGTVRLDGQDIAGLSMATRTREGLMRTFQGNRVFATLRVEQALSLGLEAPRARGGEDTVATLAQRFGLSDYLKTRVGDLPYGTQKVVNLALVAACRPRVLLLDEPFAGVGPADVMRLSAVIERFRDEGVAVAVVEHNLEALLRMADDVIVLDAGRLIFQGDPDQARVSDVVREAYLGAGGAAAHGEAS